MADAVSIDCKSIGVESSEGIRNYPASVAIVNEDKICVYNAVINPRNLQYKKYNPTLRQLTRSYLSRGLEAPRTAVKDATAAMDLYLKVAEFWEEELLNETDSSECDEDSYYTD
uniref:Uncharacterized protein n=1 Tax=Bombyx mori TaxID=7091 RepID=A0A8R2R121_BOMMO|nr:uncharacterized protein LOC101746969 isoform X2 [Bombyx mori]